MEITAPMQRIVGLLKASHHIAVVPHNRPDVDALGSALALCLALSKWGKSARIYGSNVPNFLSFLPGFDQYVVTMSNDSLDLVKRSDLILICDTHEPSRLGDWEPTIVEMMATTATAAIDHHPDQPFFSIEWIEPSASSTAEMITTMLRKSRHKMTSDIAQCLAAGILGDTGHFRNANSSRNALDATAYLVGHGADLNQISSFLDTSGSVSKVRLWGEAMRAVTTACEGRYIWTSITQAMLQRYEAIENQANGLSDHLRAVENVAVAAVLVELGHNNVRVSLRSIRGFDVQLVAQQYPGGGGHPLAAGCSIAMPLAEAAHDLRYRVGELILQGPQN
jgi:phosphoesterase RecJ-like protein